MPDGGKDFTLIAHLHPLSAECTFNRCLPMMESGVARLTAASQ